eukprot:TRINITY_DN7596_c0_g1_i1.p1 TRINITY_DN7596_c0_g1~~TRINITY_DN7596_c0_g1_i1.p1  ORF type:complete len:445 (-),score=112.81 TRINITY_DN7596_c0_g1_i1:718-2052(-)
MAAEVDELSFESLTFGDDKSHHFAHDEKDSDDSHLKASEYKESEEPEKNVLFVSATSYSDKLNHNALIKLAEELGGLKVHNFRDKQSFGFLQFADNDSYERALEKLNNSDLEGTRLIVEKTHRITPGRDPRTHEANSEFKNSTLVLKNLPFQLKQEKLEEILNGLSTKPLNVSYLYDGTGMFRGMAFVKYKEIEHATSVFEALNNLDISGRKVRVEYKRVTKESENVPDPEEKKIQDQLNSFKSNGQISELAFPAGSSYQKKQIRQVAEKLGMGHYMSGDFIVIKKNTEHKEQPMSRSIPDGKSDGFKDMHHKGAQPIQAKGMAGSAGRRRMSDAQARSPYDKGVHVQNSYDNHHSEYLSPNTKEKSQGINIVSRSLQSSSPAAHMQYLKSPPSSLGSSPTYRHSAAIMNRPGGDSMVQPIRQPKGPDGTTGFSDEYRQQRTKK